MTEEQIVTVGLALFLAGAVLFAYATRGKARKDWR